MLCRLLNVGNIRILISRIPARFVRWIDKKTRKDANWTSLNVLKTFKDGDDVRKRDKRHMETQLYITEKINNALSDNEINDKKKRDILKDIIPSEAS